MSDQEQIGQSDEAEVEGHGGGWSDIAANEETADPLASGDESDVEAHGFSLKENVKPM